MNEKTNDIKKKEDTFTVSLSKEKASVSSISTDIIDKNKEMERKQSNINRSLKKRMRSISRTAYDAKKSTFEIKDQINEMEQYLEERDNNIMKIMDEKEIEIKKESKTNRTNIYILFGIMFVYILITTALYFNTQKKIDAFEYPKTMDVIMYDQDNEKEIHYSAYTKIDTDKMTIELQEARKEKEVDISNKKE